MADNPFSMDNNDQIERARFAPDSSPEGDENLGHWSRIQLQRIQPALDLLVDSGRSAWAQIKVTWELLVSHKHTGEDGTQQVSHNDLTGRAMDGQHPISAITDLEDELNAKVYAAYIEMAAPTNQPVPDLGETWEDLAGMTPDITPLHFTDGGSGQFIPEYAGVYRLSISGAFEHDSSNSGRKTFIRLYNYTDGVAGVELILPTGRNQEATPIGVNTLISVLPASVGKSFGFQIGGGDIYIGGGDINPSVIINALNYSINNVGIVQ